MIYLVAIFLIGFCLGALLILSVKDSDRVSKDREIFTEGYKAGMKENRKEIPQKPTEDVLGYKCPVCGKSVWGLVSKMNYCGECGNRMDWGE